MGILLDDDQRQAVDTNLNTVVAAGAGSGKTRVLSLRFLRLIIEGRASVNEILTLTFTKKAAAEMKERIYGLLLEERDNPLASKALDDFDSCYITTIDSFCAQIITSGGRGFGIPSSSVVDTPGEKTLAERESYLFLLEHSTDSALETLMYTHGFERVWKEFFVSLAVNEFSLSGLRDFPGECESQIRSCVERIHSSLPQLRGILNSISVLEPQGADMTKGIDDVRRFLKEKAYLFEIDTPDTSVLSQLSIELKLKKTRAKKGDALVYREQRDEAEACVNTISSAAAFLEHKDQYRRLYSLVQKFQERFLKAKRQAGILGFRDLLQTANAILCRDTGLRTYYKNLFKYIMIDEFQDNNRLQRDLLFLLGERLDETGDSIPDFDGIAADKLFFVGDEKQSIYLFRGADVRVFKELGAEVQRGGGALLSLGTNYRSHPGLIDFFNTLFPSVMGAGGENYEAQYTPLNSRIDSSGSFSSGVYLVEESELFSDGLHLSREETEAYAAGTVILDAVQGKGLKVLKDGVETVPDFSDFALLLRSSGSQMQYEKIFRRMGIPYSADNVRSLFLEAPANDIYGILQAALIPTDRFAYALVLRCPLVGLDDTHVCRLLQDSDLPFSKEPEALGLEGLQAQRYTAGRRMVNELRQRIDSIPIHQCVEFLWYEMGYRYALLKDSAYHPYLEFIDYLTAMAREFDRRGDSLALFLEFLAQNLGKYQKIDELSIVKDEGNSIQIMSIHKSKGLEFPVVIIGSAGKNITNRQGASPYYISENHGLSVHLMKDEAGSKINPFFDEDREIQKSFEQAELKRLLYVACTRAEQHLFVVGSLTGRNRKQDTHILNLILGGLGALDTPLEHPLVKEVKPVSRKDFYSRFAGAGTVDSGGILDSIYSARVHTIEPEYTGFAATVLNTAYRASADSSHEEEVILPEIPSDQIIREKGVQANFGVLVHLLCEQKLNRILSPRVIDGILPASLSEPQTAMLMHDAERLSLNIPTQLFSHAPVVLEDPFTMLLPGDPKGRFVEGQFDCYVETEEEAHIYDFKTDAVIRRGEYEVQMALYRKALYGITGKNVRSFLVYLRSGEILEVDTDPDWDLLYSVMDRELRPIPFSE